jgi:hypothetical protein
MVRWDQEQSSCISKVHHLFTLLYQFNPSVPELHQETTWLKANTFQVMGNFQHLFGRDKVGNYVHQLQHHTADLVEWGGLWAYVNNMQETMQVLMKMTFHLWMPCFGRTGNVDTLHKVFERWYMKLYVCLLACGPPEPPGLAHELRHSTKLLTLLQPTIKCCCGLESTVFSMSGHTTFVVISVLPFSQCPGGGGDG